MTIRELFQARPAREAAIAHYGDRFEDFAESQQLYVDVPGIGDEVAKVAFLFRHAREAEIADPVPPVRPWQCCVACALYRSLPAEHKEPME